MTEIKDVGKMIFDRTRPVETLMSRFGGIYIVLVASCWQEDVVSVGSGHLDAVETLFSVVFWHLQWAYSSLICSSVGILYSSPSMA